MTEVFKKKRKKKYDKDLQIGVAGKKCDKILIINSFKKYVDRFNLGHLFKFSKLKLLMNKIQYSNSKKDKNFVLLI